MNAQTSTLADRIEAYDHALTAEEFAGLVSLSEKTIRRHIRSRKLPAYRIGSQVRLDPGATAAWLRQRLQ